MGATQQHRLKVMAGNWKMNLSPGEAIAYFNDLAVAHKSEPASSVRQVIFPPAYCLTPHVEVAASRAHVQLGAQNVHWEEKGAFTGELSGVALKHLGISWVLIGHSERRQYFGETDESAAKRLARALALDLNVVYCIGETLAEREAGKTEAVLAKQLGPFMVAAKQIGDKLSKLNSAETVHAPITTTLAIAYEPVWAIGTGKTATPAQAEAAHAFIRETLAQGLSQSVAEDLPLLYGGSVTPENSRELLALPNVDGVLVGGASLKPDSFAKILSSL